jgi:hypothetical protein
MASVVVLLECARPLMIASRRPVRVDPVHRDAVGAEFLGERLGPAGRRGANRIGDAEPRDRLAHRGRDDVHDPAIAFGAHAEDHGLDQRMVAEEVHRERGAEGIFRRGQGRARWRSAGVVDQDMEGRMVGQVFTHGPADRGRIAEIGYQRIMDDALGAGQGIAHPAELLLVPGQQHHLGAFARQGFGARATDALRAAAHQRAASLKTAHVKAS